MAQRTFTVPAGTLLPDGTRVESAIVHRITYEKGSMTPAQAQKRARSQAAASIKERYGITIGVEELQRRTGTVQKQATTGGRAPRARGGRESYMSKAVRNSVTEHGSHPDWQTVSIGKPKPLFQNIVHAVEALDTVRHPDLFQVVGHGRYIAEIRNRYTDANEEYSLDDWGKSPAYRSVAAFKKQNPTAKAFTQNVGIDLAHSIAWYIEFLPAGTLKARKQRAGGSRRG